MPPVCPPVDDSSSPCRNLEYAAVRGSGPHVVVPINAYCIDEGVPKAAVVRAFERVCTRVIIKQTLHGGKP